MSRLCRALRIALILQAFLPATTTASSILSESLTKSAKGQNVHHVLEYQPVKETSCENASPTGPIDTTSCDYETVESVNEDLFANLHDLVATPFFKYFQADLYRDCPFWDDYGLCNDPGCAITSVDESQIPEKWRATALSKAPPVEDLHSLPGCYHRDSDYCFLDDNTEGEYYDLSLIPERYTGYSGAGAGGVWGAIYRENCFGLSESAIKPGRPSAAVPDTLASHPNEDSDNQYLEKRVYYKIVSGLHASISTHICLEYLNQTTGEWAPNLQCFVNRVAAYPERLQYIYFNTVLLLRAVARLGPYLSAYDYCSTGNHEDDLETKAKLSNVLSIAQRAGKFDESVLFQGDNANVVREEFKTHFRNVTRIMDCIGCDKCRLWGKVQTTGVATALKILFEMDDKALDPDTNSNLLQRSEVVALINTLHRFSESLNAANIFRGMWQDISHTKSQEDIIREVENVPRQPRPSPGIGHEWKGNVFEEIRMRFTSLFRVCKESTAECVGMLLRLWMRALRAISSVFAPSGKEHGPGQYVEL
ncbi:hypothetical protein DFS33DRAFT_1284975 [Desarmillaria ectypa]|nr:hypothetical protein DFS33DRAFT_1284975 [Desarmillaria ectypa]